VGHLFAHKLADKWRQIFQGSAYVFTLNNCTLSKAAEYQTQSTYK
jgi:hypothetical protein